MTAETHSSLANFIWSICNLLRAAIATLQEYRTALITTAVTGKIDVRTVNNSLNSSYVA